MKTHRLFRVLPALIVATAAADTFEMKDGTKLEGTILREEGSNYVLSVQVTKSIKDERVVPKSDVVKHVRERKDETEFEELSKLVPTPDLKSADSYASDVRKVEAFIKKYPDSLRKKEAAKILDTLGDEYAIIKDGGVKFEGKMISASDRTPKAYGLDAGILAQQFAAAAEKGEYLNAMRAWSKLETGYPGSRAYRENIPNVVKVMKAYQMVVTTTLAGFDARTKERAKGLAGMDSSNRNRSEQAIKEEQDAYQARVDKEKAEGLKWLSLDPYVKPPLDETKRFLDTEIRRLEHLDLTYLPKTQEVYEETYLAVTKAGATKQEIDTALGKARSVSMPPQYLEMLTKAAPATPAP
jgi:hypothetical protein